MAQVTRTSEEILPEDRVTNALITKVDGDTAVEVPYNNYGERGYVDLIRSQGRYTQIIEVKSTPKTANQVIRQFQKMKNNFLEGTSYQYIKKNHEFKLVFTASNANLEHLKTNKQMYLSLDTTLSMADETGRVEAVWDSDGDLRKDCLNNLEGLNIDNQLICPYCGKEYKMEAYYEKHVKKCTSTDVKKISGVEA